jgi:hypothetical protein
VVDVDIALSEWSAMLDEIYKNYCDVRDREDSIERVKKKNIVLRDSPCPAYVGGLFRPVERRAM